MHRLLVEAAELEKERARLPAAAARHLKVLRLEAGEEVELFDGRGGTRVYAYHSGELTAAGPLRRVGRPDAELVLFACVTKGSRWDWTIEKATELGASRIVPVISDRTIVRLAADEREAKRARWQRIAEDAARQSDARWVPEIAAPVDFAASLAEVRKLRCFVGAILRDGRAAMPIARAVAAAKGERALAVYVGPEGDFTPAELEALMAIATPVSFGATILRAETAAIYGLSVLKAALDS